MLSREEKLRRLFDFYAELANTYLEVNLLLKQFENKKVLEPDDFRRSFVEMEGHYEMKGVPFEYDTTPQMKQMLEQFVDSKTEDELDKFMIECGLIYIPDDPGN